MSGHSASNVIDRPDTAVFEPMRSEDEAAVRGEMGFYGLDKIEVSFPVWLSGGFVRDAVGGGVPNDADLFVFQQKDFDSLCAVLKAAGFKEVGRAGTVATFEHPVTGFPVQAIFVRPYDRVGRFLADFDFRCNAAAVALVPRPFEGNSIVARGFYDDVAKREVNLLCAETSNVKRLLAFASRGWTIGKEVLPTLLKQIEDDDREPKDVFFGGAFLEDYEGNAL